MLKFGSAATERFGAEEDRVVGWIPCWFFFFGDHAGDVERGTGLRVCFFFAFCCSLLVGSGGTEYGSHRDFVLKAADQGTTVGISDAEVIVWWLQGAAASSKVAGLSFGVSLIWESEE